MAKALSDRAGFWCDDYHRTQRLLLDGRPDHTTERETLMEIRCWTYEIFGWLLGLFVCSFYRASTAVSPYPRFKLFDISKNDTR